MNSIKNIDICYIKYNINKKTLLLNFTFKKESYFLTKIIKLQLNIIMLFSEKNFNCREITVKNKVGRQSIINHINLHDIIDRNNYKRHNSLLKVSKCASCHKALYNYLRELDRSQNIARNWFIGRFITFCGFLRPSFFMAVQQCF